VDASRYPPADRAAGSELIGRFRSIAKIAIVDVAAPLATYGVARSAGMSAATALVLSGVFPAAAVGATAVRRRRLDVVGGLVLLGIVVGSVLGLISHDARLVLMEGSAPTAVFGAACLATVWSRRPLMYGFALEFIGPETAKGREMTGLWQYEGFRRIFRVITAVWGVGFLLEAAARIVIIEHTSAGTALSLSKAMPPVCAGVFAAWTFAYGKHQGRKNAGGGVT
jgi:hypothetical protein